MLIHGFYLLLDLRRQVLFVLTVKQPPNKALSQITPVAVIPVVKLSLYHITNSEEENYQGVFLVIGYCLFLLIDLTFSTWLVIYQDAPARLSWNMDFQPSLELIVWSVFNNLARRLTVNFFYESARILTHDLPLPRRTLLVYYRATRSVQSNSY